MANSLKLYVDTQNNKLVVSDTDASAFTLPTLFQGDVLAVELKLLEPNTSGGLSTPFNVITTSYTTKLAIGTPDPSSSTVFTSATLTFDAGTNVYSGNLILNNTGTPSIASLLASATSATATFEIEVSGGGNYSTETQEQIVIKADAIKTGTPMTPPVTGYYTEAESDATFVAKAGGTMSGMLTMSNTARMKFIPLEDSAITGAGNHTLNSNNAVFVKLDTLAAAGNLSGITGGEAGRFLIIYNSSTAHSLTIKHDDSNATATNRIYTMTAADVALTARGSAMFLYDGDDDRWIVISVNP
jgi:hypothetical protein